MSSLTSFSLCVLYVTIKKNNMQEEIFLIALLIMIGAGVGFISGLIGIGGNSLMTPIMILVLSRLGFSTNTAVKTAFGTSLLIGSLTALTGFLIHRQRIGSQRKIAIPLTIPLIIGAVFGSILASNLSSNSLKLALGVALLIVSVHMTVGSIKKDSNNIPALSKPLLVSGGLLIGFFASLVGMGGAIFTSIVFVNIFKYPIHRVVGITTFAQIFGALFGAIGYLLHGYINWYVALFMLIGAVPSAYLGAKFAHRLDAKWLKRAFGIMLSIISIRILWKG